MFEHLIDLISSRFPQQVRELENIAVENPVINAFVIDRLASSSASRPHPFSLASDYTSWTSLTDRSYTGRHLPVADQSYTDFLTNVDVKELGQLFRRQKDQMICCVRSSVMFTAFAQWFTDGFLRTDSQDPRRNTSNHEIDMCQIYGLKESITNQLRLKEGGKLKSQIINGEEYPPYAFENGKLKDEFSELTVWGPASTSIPLDLSPDEIEQRQAKMFAMGTERANSTLGYVMLNTLFLREHNRIANLLKSKYSDWDDERLFQTARNVIIVLLIKIVVEDYIAHISGINLKADPTIGYNQKWYRTNRMTIEFDLLYRWHSLTPDKFNTPVGLVNFNDYMYNNSLVIDYGIGKAFEALSNQKAGKIGLGNTPDFLFPIEQKNISYARNFRLRSYNEYKVCFGGNKAKDFSDITKNEELQKKLSDLYQSVDNVEWYVGMYAEDRSPLALIGQLQTTMVANDAFSQALTNPLLAERVFNKETFSSVGWEIINETNSLNQILQRNIDTNQNCSFHYAN
jgi:prostaglandin-endoperoxide synthase 2